MRSATQVLEGGRITIPKRVRDELCLKRGDVIVIDVTPVEKVEERENVA
jgi:AbrB family looped-hinge helix DNA binding protein